MRLPILFSTGFAALGMLALAGQAQAHDSRGRGMSMPPPMDGPDGYDADMPPPDMPPPYAPGPGYDGPHGPHAYPGGPMPGAMMPPCGGPHAHPGPGPCAPYGYPGYAMTYGVPMIMVPVLRQKPCPERVVEEWVEEPVRVRRRYIPARRHVIPDKRVPMVPDKRVPTKRIPY